MKHRLLSPEKHHREWVIIFDPGDEVAEGLKSFAQREQLTAAHFAGIGAFSGVTVAWFDLATKTYQPIEIAEQVEVLTLMGDVALADGKPAVHAHICVAKRDGSAHGGHLLKGQVRPTLELTVRESPAHLRKTFRKEFGRALIDLQQSDVIEEKETSTTSKE